MTVAPRTASQRMVCSSAKRKHTRVCEANMHLNSKITMAAETKDLKVLLDTIALYVEDMNDINLATAMHRVGKLSSQKGIKNVESFTESAEFQRLYQAVANRILCHPLRACEVNKLGSAPKSMPVSCLSIIVWSLAMMKLGDNVLMTAISEIATPRIYDFQPFEFAQLVWAYAKHGSPDAQLFAAASRRLLLRLPGEFKGVSLSMIAWAFAELQVHDVPLFRSLAEELRSGVADLKPQELATIGHSFSRVDIYDAGLFEEFSVVATTACKVDIFKPRELIDVLWAYARAGHRVPALFSAASGVLYRKRWLLSASQLATAIWAFNELQVSECESVLDSLLEALMCKTKSKSQEELFSLLCCCVELGCSCDSVLLHLLRSMPLNSLEPAVLALPSEMLLYVLERWAGSDEAQHALFAINECAARCPSMTDVELLATLRVVLVATMNSTLAPQHSWGLATAVTQVLVPNVGMMCGATSCQLTHILGLLQGTLCEAALAPLHFALEECGQACYGSETTIGAASGFATSEASDASEDRHWESFDALGCASTRSDSRSPHGSVDCCFTPAARTPPLAMAEQDAAAADTWPLSEIMQSKTMHWTIVARIAQAILAQAEALVDIYGTDALEAVRFSNISLDGRGIPTFVMPVMPQVQASSIVEDPWPLLCYRFGLLLRCITDRLCVAEQCPKPFLDLTMSCLHNGIPPSRQTVAIALSDLGHKV